jgi:phage N-6-adenine-methyltransferase
MPNDEWCTPPHIAAAARIVLGGIDFDPFSSPQGNESIKASKYWTKKDDAFAAPWPVHSNSSVWMNPPYSRVLIVETVNTFCKHQLSIGFRGIVLVNNSTETGWFDRLLWHADSICLFRKRIYFFLDGEKHRNNRQGQVAFYFGDDCDLFDRNFRELGNIVRSKKI